MTVSLCLALCGCPADDGQLDEQKENHFQAGRDHVNSHDYQAAVEDYEKSLEVIPHSASAHFELGWLYEQKIGDPAAAIYHYQRFLALQPNSDKADQAKTRINACKLDLAKAVSTIGPQLPAVPHDWEKLLAENRELKEQLARWQAFYAANRPAIATNPAPPAITPATNAARRVLETVPTDNPRPAAAAVILPSVSGSAPAIPAAPAGANRHATAASPRTYTVKPGENPAAIARKFGVPLDALLAANPLIRPTHLLVGQVLNIPNP
jgi:tetratricopeptide (TPR) repeat protein